MTKNQELQIDPNAADLESLTQLPGIGPEMAKRILDARPFNNLEELLNVEGLGKDTLSQIEPYLIIGGKAPLLTELTGRAQERMDEWSQATSQIFEKQKEQLAEEVSRASDQIQKLAQEAGTRVRDVTQQASGRVTGLSDDFQRIETRWFVIGTGVISAILAVILSLVILAGINGTLNIRSHEVVRQMQTDLSAVQTDLESEAARLEALDQRLAALEGLSGRMVAVEDQVDAMRQEVTESRNTVEEMRGDVTDLKSETEDLAGRVSRFDIFLDGLNRLVSGLFVSDTEQ